MWQFLKDWRQECGTHVIGWNERWGVAEFMRHDDGWTVASFNGQLIRSSPVMWRPLPRPPEF